MGRSIYQGSGGFKVPEEGSGSVEQFRDAVKGNVPMKTFRMRNPFLSSSIHAFRAVLCELIVVLILYAGNLESLEKNMGETIADTEVTMEGGQEADGRQRMDVEEDDVESEDYEECEELQEDLVFRDSDEEEEDGSVAENRWTFMSDQQKGLVNILAESALTGIKCFSVDSQPKEF
ncbi:hypothetical protein J5N97_019963 [Dioscorea zingiberensis]|uniref:Uncharacterized protein n=1 Tax=Dioscorea zingiberensis TaxID=325984 RepID=A0A9D5HCZ5_9LILI|nr:hypothetical protein J5N97_019963 [Dioscorea zingiberensis]